MDEDGKPVAGARVHLYFNKQTAAGLYRYITDGKPTTTDAAGRFRIDVPFAAIAFNLSFSHKGKYLDASKAERSITVKSGETKELADLVVKEVE
jgi:hypothetical protein